MSTYDEFCIKNEEFCIKNEELCIINKEICIKHDEFCRKPVLGTWLEMYFPAVVYPPGTVPGCYMYGYALLGHALEAKANRPFWHLAHHKLLSPMGMTSTSYGGPHLPDPGPDAAEERNRYTVLDNSAAARDREMTAMVDQIDGAKEQLRIENDPKAAARKAKSGAMAVVGVTNGARRKLQNMEDKHNVRYEELEKERQADDAAREELDEDATLSLVAVAGSLPQKRPARWKGVWPPRRWQGHTSYPPLWPTMLWNHGPRKYKPPDPSEGPMGWMIAKVAIAWGEFVGSIAWRTEAFKSVLDPGEAESALRKGRKEAEQSSGPKIPSALLNFVQADGGEDEEEVLPTKPLLITRRQKYARIPSLAPAIGMHSTARDMGKLMGCLLAGKYAPGTARGKKPILHPRTVQAGLARYWSPHPSLPGMTLLGFAEMYHGSRRYLICDGADPASGTCATMILIPDYTPTVGVFLAFNCCGHGAAKVRPTLAERLLDYYYPVDKEPPPSVPEDEDESESAAGSQVDEYEAYKPDGKEMNVSMTYGANMGETKLGGGVTGLYASGLQGVENARESTAMDPEALRKQAQDALDKEQREKEEADAKVLAKREADEARFDALEGGGKKKKKKPKKLKSTETDAGLKASWFDNHFKDYTEAIASGDMDAVDRLVAKADKDARKTAGYDPSTYIGTYISTAASVGTIDRLRNFQSQVKVGIDRDGRLYLRRAGVAGGPDCGVGPCHRGLSENAFTDCSLVCVDATKHVFKRADRPMGDYAEQNAKDGKPAGVIAFGTDFNENVTHLFLQPCSLSFRRLEWWEGLGPTYVFTLVAAISYSLGLFIWWFIAPGGPRFPWNIDWVSKNPITGLNESMPKEFASWLLCWALFANTFSSLCFAMYLPLATHTGLVDTWHSPGPPLFVRVLLWLIFAGVVFGKGLVCMCIYVWVRGWWSPWERLIYTYEALLLIPWNLLLDHWNLIFWKY